MALARSSCYFSYILKYKSTAGRCLNTLTLNKYKLKFVERPLALKYLNKHVYSTDKHEEKEKQSLLQKFKQMYREYWYVLVPVHLITSAFWATGFYYMAKSGVDIEKLLESCNVSERFIQPFKDSSMGYVAVTYALYKIATPLRYTVTLGGTTISINYLKKWGYIKPIPNREALQKMYNKKKEDIKESFKETKQEIKHKSQLFESKLHLEDKINKVKELTSKPLKRK